MKKIFAGAIALALAAAVPGSAQSLDELNIQIHGYATQGFLYTTNNNILTTSSSDGSPQWTEAVVNVSAQPIPKLRFGLQGRYELLGNYQNGFTLDWAQGDYKVNDRFGARFGKVKVPSGLLNDIQDIDPSYLWGLLPQSIYPLPNRNFILTVYGGVVYGTIKLPATLGKLEYRGWGGESQLASNDGYFTAYTEAGIAVPNGISDTRIGEALHWQTPLRGLMVGASNTTANQESALITAANGALKGTLSVARSNEPGYFARYEKDKLMVAVEYQRNNPSVLFQFAGPAAPQTRLDFRSEYGMASYKVTDKLTGGVYYSQEFDHQAALGPARYQKDWDIAGRYDFNQYVYAKAEEHFIEGTLNNYDANLNPGGLKPNSKLTVLKIGVRF